MGRLMSDGYSRWADLCLMVILDGKAVQCAGFGWKVVPDSQLPFCYSHIVSILKTGH